MALVRRLTEEGRDAFRRWIVEGAAGGAPCELLEGAATSERVKPDAVVSQGPFTTRLECGRHLRDRLSGLPRGGIRFDAGLWDWLSLFYIDQVLPLADDGRRRRSGLEFYSLDAGRLGYRHLIRTAWQAVEIHGDAARFLLSRPMNEGGQLQESVAGQNAFFGSTTMMMVADALYWDSDGAKVKRGAQSDPNKVRRAGGVVRRLMPVASQLALTFDVHAMSAEQIMALLPREFDRWKPTAGDRRSAAAEEASASV